MQQSGKAHTILARIMMAAFFLPMKLQAGVMFVLLLLFLIQSKPSIKNITKSQLILAMCIGSSLLLCAASFVLTPSAFRIMLMHICERKLALVFIPVAFLFLPRQMLDAIRKEQIYFAYACCVVCVAGNIAFLLQYYGPGSVHEAVTHVQYRQYLEKALNFHPTYLGMYISFALCILFSSDQGVDKRMRLFQYVVAAILLVCLLASLAKAPILALIVISLHFAWLHRKNLANYRWQMIGLAGLVVAAYCFVPFFRQRVAEMTGYTPTRNIEQVQDNSINQRRLILNTDMAALHDYWLAGAGPGRLQQVLNHHYLVVSLANRFNTGWFDPHSEYLWHWLSFGLAGIIIIAISLLYQFRIAIVNRDHLYLYLLLILAITFFTESVLSRQYGVFLYAFFCGLYGLLILKKETSDIK